MPTERRPAGGRPGRTPRSITAPVWPCRTATSCRPVARHTRMVRSVPAEATHCPSGLYAGGDDLAGMAVVRRFDLLARRGVPLAHRPVRRGRHQARAVRAERDAEDLARVPPARGQQCAGGRVPHARRPVLAARGQPRAVRAEGVRPDVARVAFANRRLLPGSRVKHADAETSSSVMPVHDQPCAVRAHDDTDRNSPARGQSTRQRTRPLVEQVKGSCCPTHARREGRAGLDRRRPEYKVRARARRERP